MKLLRYRHEMMTPLVVALGRAIHAAAGRRLSPVLSRLLPGRRGRRIIGAILLGVSLAIQIVLVWLITELVHISIDVMELWALLARKHMEITLS